MHTKRVRLSPPKAWELVLGWLVIITVCVSDGWTAPADATVAADDSGQFKSVQEATNAAPRITGPDKRWLINIKPGIYKELIYVQREKSFISLVGEDAEKTILTAATHCQGPASAGYST